MGGFFFRGAIISGIVFANLALMYFDFLNVRKPLTSQAGTNPVILLVHFSD